MNISYCQPPDPNPRRPRFSLPPGACDTHAHVFGPESRYPYNPERSYTPPEALLTTYSDLLRTLGFERAVLVQPSVYGTDNRAMLDALRSPHRDIRFRGVCVVDEGVSYEELVTFHEAGVRGIRCNLLNKGGISPDVASTIAGKVACFGWHMQLLLDVSNFGNLAQFVTQLQVPVVVDHMGHFSVSKGTKNRGFLNLLSLLRDGDCWVKLSAPYRLTQSTQPHFDDVLPIVESLVCTNEDALLWGTDWPHPNVEVPMPNDGQLVDLIMEWLPTEHVREKVLVKNPAKLYEFS